MEADTPNKYSALQTDVKKHTRGYVWFFVRAYTQRYKQQRQQHYYAYGDTRDTDVHTVSLGCGVYACVCDMVDILCDVIKRNPVLLDKNKVIIGAHWSHAL